MPAKFATSILSLEQFMVVLWLHSAADPPPDEWHAALSEFARFRHSQRTEVDRIRQVVISDGGAPNAKQRKQASECLDGLPSKLAVLTTVLSNPMKRGAATAFSWLNPAIRFYSPTEFAKALVYLDLERSRVAIEYEFEQLQKRLAPVQALRLI